MVSDKYTVTQMSAVQKRAYSASNAMRKAQRLIEKLERELAKARAQLSQAQSRYQEAKAILEAHDVKETTRGFRVDDQGYVVSKTADLPCNVVKLQVKG